MNINVVRKGVLQRNWFVLDQLEHLVSNVGRCTNRKAQAQHHAGSLGDKPDQVEGCGRLIRGTVEKGFVQKHFYFKKGMFCFFK